MEYFYYAVAILPIIIAIVCLILYIVNKPSNPSGVWPTYGDIVGSHPQFRVFSIGTNFEAIFLLFFGLIRDHILVYVLEKSDRSNQILSITLLQASRFSIIVSCFSLMILAHAPADEGLLHAITNGFFFVSTLLYFLTGDILTWKSSSKLKIVSFVVTIAGWIAAALFTILEYGTDKKNAATVFSYIPIIVLIGKLFFTKKEMINHGIRITRRLIYNSDERVE